MNLSQASSFSGASERCAACRSDQGRVLFHSYAFDDPAEHFDVVRCSNCELSRVFPFPQPEELKRYYAPSYYGGSADAADSHEEKFSKPVELMVKVANRLRAGPVVSLMGERDPASCRVLDIGCGRGNFLKFLHQRGFNCFGTEIPTFPLPPSQPGLTFVHGTIENLPFEKGYFDAVSIWHVLEHTANPLSTIQKIAEVLKLGGVLAVAVPNFGSLQSRAFGRHWFHLDLPRHLYHLDQAVLSKMLLDSGLKPVRVQTNSLDQNLFGFIQSFLNALFPARPNWLYALLKHQRKGKWTSAELLFGGVQLLLAALLFPVSVVGNLVSVLFGRGASLIIYARKI